MKIYKIKNPPKKSLIFIVSVIFTIISFNAFTFNNDKSTPIKYGTYYYELEVALLDNELQFNVSLVYKSDSTHVISLPTDYYGTPDIHRWVTKMVGVQGTQIIDKDSNSKTVIPNKNNEVHLKYSIKYNSEELDKYSYAPIVSPNYFYMAGCQWILPATPIGKEFDFKISMATSIPNWKLYSSLSEDVSNIEVTSSFENLISAGFGGSDKSQTINTFEIGTSQVSLFINGDFNFNKKELIDELQRIIQSQVNYFGEYDQPYYYITILPRTSLLAGASIPNLFYCFVDSSTQSTELLELIAHEHFHNWLPNKMYLATPKGEYEFKREWFSEGFTDYISRWLLKEEKIISEDYFIDQINNDLISIANNPSANEAHLDIAKRADWGAAQKKLSYYRGALIALKWEKELNEKKSTLQELMLYLYERSKESNGKIEDSDIYSFGELKGLSFKTDIENYIDKGLPIEVPSAIGDYSLMVKNIALFSPGFDVKKSASEKVIQGVDESGPAYHAGLRNGMEYVRRRNSNRWSNSWSDKKPYIVTVKLGDKEKEISFFPTGDLVKLSLYEKK